jgi:hypothetical protein
VKQEARLTGNRTGGYALIPACDMLRKPTFRRGQFDLPIVMACMLFSLLVVFPGTVAAQVHSPDVAEPAPEIRPHPQSEPLLGGGHVTIGEISVRDTLSIALQHSYGVGFYGVISAVAEPVKANAASARVARLATSGHLAGGQSGLDAGLHVDFSHGTRWPPAGHGVVIRGGGQLQIEGNRQYYLSAVHAPSLDVGYQYVGNGQIVELSLRGSVLWDGRLRIDDNPSTNLPIAPSWGALLEAGSKPLWLSMQFVRRDTVSQTAINLCSRPASLWSLCVRIARAAEGPTLGDPMHRLLIGTIGVGLVQP